MTQHGIVDHIRVYWANGIFRAAIYSEAGGEPGALMAESGPETVTTGAWINADIPDVLLAPGTYYLALQGWSGMSRVDTTKRIPGYYPYPWTFGPFPATAPSGMNYDEKDYDYYAPYCAVLWTSTPTPTGTWFTPTPTPTPTPPNTRTPTPFPTPT
jgi:hypothetical protein